MASSRYYAPDDIVHENTPYFKGDESFDDGSVTDHKLQVDDLECSLNSISPFYTRFSIVFCLSDLGFGARRRRVWTWMRHTASVHLMQMPPGTSQTELFKMMFFRHRTMNAASYLMLPDEILDKHRERWYKSGMFGPFGSGSNKVRLLYYQDAYDQHVAVHGRRSLPPASLIDINSNYKFSKWDISKQGAAIAPTLTGKSQLYDIVSQREVPPIVHMAMLGFPVPELAPQAFAQHFPFPSLVSVYPRGDDRPRILKDTEVKTMSGNSFAVPHAGGVLQFILSTSKLI